jgi:hypothetical protein
MILADGVGERITQWAGTDIGRARAARSVWPKNSYSEACSAAFTELQKLRAELFGLKYPYTRDKIRNTELSALIEQAEKNYSDLSAKVTDEYARRHPQYEVLEGLCAVYRARNRDHPSVEHRVPVIAGGTNDDENLAIAHLGCNLSRGENSQLIADLMTANQRGVPPEGRAAFLEEQQRYREETARLLREAEQRRQKERAAAARWAQDLRAARTEDDELRRELRRLGDRLRRTHDEKEHRRLQVHRGRVKAKRERLGIKLRSLEGQYWWMSERDALLQAPPPGDADVGTEKVVAGVVVEAPAVTVDELGGRRGDVTPLARPYAAVHDRPSRR